MVFKIKKEELNIKIDFKNAPIIMRSVQNRLTLMFKRILDVCKMQNIEINPDYFCADVKYEYKMSQEQSPHKSKNKKQIEDNTATNQPQKVKYESVS